MRTNAEPMKPAPPVTRIFMELFVLRFPIVVDAGIVPGNAAFVLRIVEAVGKVDQQGVFAADNLIAVRDTGGNQHLPRTQVADVDGVARTEGRRTESKVGQGDLKHAFYRSPAVGLMEMVVECLDGAGKIHGSGYL